jgi:diaminopimelate decarboxylase
MKIDVLQNTVKTYQTPLYLYDADKIKFQYSCLKDSLPENFEIFYSMKANPLLGICQLFNTLGSNIEVASGGELHIALEAGFSPSNIIFTSPGKTYEELELAIDTGIYSINIESFEEAEIINTIAQAKSKNVDISIRINPDYDVSGAGIKMSGVATQFGIDYKQALEGIKALALLPNINIVGIHVYTGTQVLKAENIIANMGETIKMALNISDHTGIRLKFLDLGGGFGIPYFKGDIELDTDALKQGILKVWNTHKNDIVGIRIAVESGRFLMAEAGVFLTKVLYTKENKGSSYIICDGGSNFHANSAFLGRHIRNNFPMHILGKEDQEAYEVNVVGSLCTPTDVIGQKVLLPKAEAGDVLVVEKSGAYGLTNSPTLFLSHPAPEEVIYIEGNIRILRQRASKEDFSKGQNRLFT